ncbi:MAG: hypothetical protein AB7F89_24255 [Pirellulaceae bacterium]
MNWDVHTWYQTFTKTQCYVRHRLQGEDCRRDLVEAWRQFYQTHEPLIRVMVTRQGLSGSEALGAVERIWAGILLELPKLRPHVSYDYFLHWLTQLARDRARAVAVAATETAAGRPAGGTAAGEPAASQHRAGATWTDSRLFQLRIVEDRPVDDVARVLGLSPSQVTRRQDDILGKILNVLIRLDIPLSQTADC